jgi:hypothetical protein
VAPATLMTAEDLENLEFLIRRKGFSLRDALAKYVELYPDRKEGFHNACLDAGYQLYATQVLTEKGLEIITKTRTKLFPK